MFGQSHLVSKDWGLAPVSAALGQHRAGYQGAMDPTDMVVSNGFHQWG